jgi:glycosyltransferase involved in cell wall biosynthesis
MEPLITIIIPVYNTENQIGRCLNSVVNKTHTNLEIFLIDDGSTYNCPQICDEYSERDLRI